MTTHTLTHAGADRLIQASANIADSVGPLPRVRPLTLVVLTGIVTALAVLADRIVHIALTDGFTGEWLAMWALAMALTFLFGRASDVLAGAILRSVGIFGRLREDQAFAEALARDPRMLEDLRAAKLHAERVSGAE